MSQKSPRGEMRPTVKAEGEGEQRLNLTSDRLVKSLRFPGTVMQLLRRRPTAETAPLASSANPYCTAAAQGHEVSVCWPTYCELCEGWCASKVPYSMQAQSDGSFCEPIVELGSPMTSSYDRSRGE